MPSNTSASIEILIADDHPIFRKGLREVIEEDEDLVIVGQAADGLEAFEFIQRLRPRVAVVDIEMPKKDGFSLVEAVKESRLDVSIIFLTMYKEERSFNRALDLGVRGYVLKDSAANEIVNAIKAVAAGQHYISPAIQTFLINRNARSARLAEQKSGIQLLTPMELRILRLIAEKKTSKEIANDLFISHRTVDNHRNNICGKLELRGSNALLKFAIEHKSELS